MVWILIVCGAGEQRRIKKEAYDSCITSTFEDCGILHEKTFRFSLFSNRRGIEKMPDAFK